MKGMGVAEVIYSKDAKLKVGDKVLGLTYWQKYSILKAKELTLLPLPTEQLVRPLIALFDEWKRATCPRCMGSMHEFSQLLK